MAGQQQNPQQLMQQLQQFMQSGQANSMNVNQPQSTGNAFTNFFQSTPARSTSVPIYNQAQQGGFSNALQQGQQGLQRDFSFAPIADKYRNNWESKVAPGLAERFQNIGGRANSNRGSSGLRGALAGGRSELESSLAALEQQYNLQDRDFFKSLLQTGLTPQNENTYEPEKQSDFMSLLMALLSAGGQVGGSYLANAGKFAAAAA